MSWAKGLGFFKNLGNVFGGIGQGAGGFMGNFGTGKGFLSSIGQGGGNFLGKFGTGKGLLGTMGQGGGNFLGKFGTGQGALSNVFTPKLITDPNQFMSNVNLDPISQGVSNYDARFTGDSSASAVDDYNSRFVSPVDLPAVNDDPVSQGISNYESQFVQPVTSDPVVDTPNTTNVTPTNPISQGVQNYESQFVQPVTDTSTDSAPVDPVTGAVDAYNDRFEASSSMNDDSAGIVDSTEEYNPIASGVTDYESRFDELSSASDKLSAADETTVPMDMLTDNRVSDYNDRFTEDPSLSQIDTNQSYDPNSAVDAYNARFVDNNIADEDDDFFADDDLADWNNMSPDEQEAHIKKQKRRSRLKFGAGMLGKGLLGALVAGSAKGALPGMLSHFQGKSMESMLPSEESEAISLGGGSGKGNYSIGGRDYNFVDVTGANNPYMKWDDTPIRQGLAGFYNPRT